MADIKQIAATYAARIFDRMEMCRGSAILKSDIEREVEAALREYTGPHMPEGPVYGASPAMGILGEHRKCLEEYRIISERSVDPPQMKTATEVQERLDEYQARLNAKNA
jgi:hypothetical protein